MTNQVSTFTFNTTALRTVTIKGEPWFVAKDVCDVLGISNPTDALHNIDFTEVMDFKFPGTKGRPNKLVSESGLYKLIMRSNKPSAKPFQDWVTKVVLPAIRKDGAYVMGEEKVATGQMSEDEFVLKAMTILQAKVQRLTAENVAMRDELTFLCVAEYAALNHMYLHQEERLKLAYRAGKLHKEAMVPITKSPRTIRKYNTDFASEVNVYRRDFLDAAADDLQLFQKTKTPRRALAVGMVH